MLVDAFDFTLPEDRIAQHPMTPRERAKLLHVQAAELTDHHIADLPSLLRPGDVMVFNDTKVIPARLTGLRLSDTGPGAKVELTLHKANGGPNWQAFAKPAKKLKPGNTIQFAEGFHADVTAKGDEGEVTICFDRQGPALDEALRLYGIMPLPPYIKRGEGGNPDDQDDYQTVYADKPGAVAAPTAGLHFTEALLDTIRAKGVEIVTLTLHVGAGTFLPVKAGDTKDHKMHSEWGQVPTDAADQVNAARAKGGRVIATGTTSLRLLESAADDNGTLQAFQGDTDIFITPGYRFKIVDRLMTNFHLPRSTLFMLVSAFSGLDTMQAAYAHAIAERYRFYSYGDACFLERRDPT